MRAVQVFGFHLATIDLRQSSDQHEPVVAELLRVARIEADYAALGEDARRDRLLALLDDARPLRVRGHAYSELAQGELAVFEAAREALQRFGRHAIRHYIISHTEEVSDLLEVLLLQKECGLMRGTLDGEAHADLIVVPLFETIEDLRQAEPIMRDYYALPGVLPLVLRSRVGAMPSRTSCSATATATRTAASSPATGSSTAPRPRWCRCSSR